MINNEKKDKYLLTKSILFSKIIIGTFYIFACSYWEHGQEKILLKNKEIEKMTTFMQKKETVDRKWYVIDAKGESLGRVAAKAAHMLRGKHKVTYTPHVIMTTQDMQGA